MYLYIYNVYSVGCGNIVQTCSCVRMGGAQIALSGGVLTNGLGNSQSQFLTFDVSLGVRLLFGIVLNCVSTMILFNFLEWLIFSWSRGRGFECFFGGRRIHEFKKKWLKERKIGFLCQFEHPQRTLGKY